MTDYEAVIKGSAKMTRAKLSKTFTGSQFWYQGLMQKRFVKILRLATSSETEPHPGHIVWQSSTKQKSFVKIRWTMGP